MIVRFGQVVQYGQEDVGQTLTASAPDLAGVDVPIGTLFLVSVGAGVTVWAITTGLRALFGLDGKRAR